MSTVGQALVAREANANISDHQDYVLPSHKVQVDSLTKLCASGVGKHCNRNSAQHNDIGLAAQSKLLSARPSWDFY